MMAVQPAAGTRFTQLHLGITRLLVVQPEIREIAAVDDLDPSEPPQGGVGWIRINQQTCPVYCLSEEFELLNAIPQSRQFCVMLVHSGGMYGLLTDRVDMLESVVAESVFPLPECMRLPDSPVEALVLQSDGVFCLTSALRLALLLPHALQHSRSLQVEAVCA